MRMATVNTATASPSPAGPGLASTRRALSAIPASTAARTWSGKRRRTSRGSPISRPRITAAGFDAVTRSPSWCPITLPIEAATTNQVTATSTTGAGTRGMRRRGAAIGVIARH